MDEKTKKRGAFTARVLVNERICDEHFRLTLGVDNFPPSRPGQFVQLQCRRPGQQAGAGEVEWTDAKPPKFTQEELVKVEPLLRRPLSLASRRDGELDIIYRTVGTGTCWLSGVETGEELSVLGPLGNAFEISTEKPFVALVGGGVGIPPMLYLSEALAAAGKKIIAFNGARTSSLLPLEFISRQYATHDVEVSIATDDGSLGFFGLISEPFECWLDGQSDTRRDVVVYTCGPEPMMRAIAEICIERDVECHVSLERYMACGMGTCQSCVVKIRDNSEQGWTYQLCCKDGPVFEADRVIWD